MAAKTPQPASDSTKTVLAHVENTLDPIIFPDSRVLLLGSMPSPKSREIGFYFGNPQNRFWRVVAALYGEKPLKSIPEKIDFCKRHHLALCDVLKACDIKGASDASIANPVPHNIGALIQDSSICAIFTLGGTATKFYKRYTEQQTGISARQLPSTSPANARMSVDDLVEEFSIIKKFTNCELTIS